MSATRARRRTSAPPCHRCRCQPGIAAAATHAQCHALLETRLRFGSSLRRSLEAAGVPLLTPACLGSDRPAGRAVRGRPCDPAQPHPQLLHHFARRPRQEYARRPPDGHHRCCAQRQVARAAARLARGRAQPRHHGEGADGLALSPRRRVGRAVPAQPHRHSGPRRLLVRGQPLDCGVPGGLR